MSRRSIVLVLALVLGAAVLLAACGSSDEEAAAPPAVAAEPAAPPAELGKEADRGAAEDVPAAAEAAAVTGEEPLPPLDGLDATQPRVIQTATLGISVPKGDFDETIDRARQIAASLGGFVTSSTSRQGPDERLVQGSLVVRVPGQLYPQALSRFEDLGRVVRREESGTDVSLQYVDLEARERHLEAVEQQLLGFLGDTETVADALVVQQRLNKVQLQLEEVRGRLRYLDDQTSFATISLEVAERGVVPAKPRDEGGWTLADAWHAAVNGIESVAGGLLVVLVTAGPILAALAVAALGVRSLLRRRRSERRAADTAGSAAG